MGDSTLVGVAMAERATDLGALPWWNGSDPLENRVAHGPGMLELAHQPDEWCSIDDLVNATRVLALAIVDLVGIDGVA